MKLARGTCVAYEHPPGDGRGHHAGRRVFEHVKKGTIFGPIERIEHTVAFVACLCRIKDPKSQKTLKLWFNPWGRLQPHRAPRAAGERWDGVLHDHQRAQRGGAEHHPQ